MSGVSVAPEEDRERASRYLAYLLRHHPEDAGLELDPKGGWVSVSSLLSGINKRSRGRRWSEEWLRKLVSSQRRFVLRGGRICARRGHSVPGITPLHRLKKSPAKTRPESEAGEGRRASRRVRKAGILQPIEPPDSLFLAVNEKSWRRALAGDGLRLRRGEFLKLFADWPSAARQAKRLRQGRVVVVSAQRAWTQGVSFFEGRRGGFRVAFLPRRFLRGGDRGLERQRAAGCVVVRRPQRGAAEFILIRTRPRGGVVEFRGEGARQIERRQALEAFLESWAERGRLELPKGKIEQGETAEGAALRELREETGIHTPLSVICPLPTVSYVFRQSDGRAVSKSIHFFLVRSDDEDPAFMPQDPEGIVGVEWHPPDAALEKVAFENLRPILRAARDLVRRGADLAAG